MTDHPADADPDPPTGARHPDEPDGPDGPDEDEDEDEAPVRSPGPPGPPAGGGPSMSRRFLLRRLAVVSGLAVAGGAAYEGVRLATASPKRPPPRRRPTGTEAPRPFLARTAEGVVIPVSPAIVAENARPGTPWWVDRVQTPRSIEGFCDQVSAQGGDEVTLYVNTAAPSFHAEAYRMGYYGGLGGRLVWRSEEVSGQQQPPPVLSATSAGGLVNTVDCRWTPSLTLRVGADWTPGAYLFKLVGSGGEQQYVPLCIRDDASHAAVVIQHSVTTWQAYNRWGGYSLYNGNSGGALSFTHAGGDFANRARIVSFDRPYDWDWANGAADFIGNELPVLYHAERLGLDVTYWTDIDLHARPQLLGQHRALVSLGHDEYWSTAMRDGAQSALDAGVNLAFLGANACYRQIRLESSPLGDQRHQVCYKSAAEDPLTGTENAQVTVNWPQDPVDRPECTLIGLTYQDVGAEADLVVADASHWLLAGCGVRDGDRLPHVVQGEFDRYVPGSLGPANLDVVCHSPVANRRGNYSDLSWYTVPRGGGVFASGSATFVGSIVDNTGFPTNIVPGPVPGVTEPLLRLMVNLYSVIGTGPGSLQPSNATWQAAYAKTNGPATPTPANSA